MKYELIKTDKIVINDSTIVYRIKALKNFGNVKSGDLGGYVESFNNLSQSGNCWVYDKAVVSGKARVTGHAKIMGNARVFGRARVYDYAIVSGHASVSGNAQVCGRALVTGDAQVFGRAINSGTTIYSNRPDKHRIYKYI